MSGKLWTGKFSTIAVKASVLETYPLAICSKIYIGRFHGKKRYDYGIYTDLEQIALEKPFATGGTVCKTWESAKLKIQEMECVK